MPDEGLHGLHPTYRLYATAEEQWVFLAIPEEKEKRRFIERLAELGIDVDTAILSKNDETTVGHLSEIFKGKDAEFWEAQLAPEGVGCVRADRCSPVEFWWHDPQVKALNLTQPTEHPAWGAYDRHGANVTFGRRQPKLKPPPTAGQHAEELLAEVGYDEAAIANLFAQGTVWQEQI
jgi:crotonobetainyl-CoA:carnitine CoA-transferase CaiB-like acyl-CoA transferase